MPLETCAKPIFVPVTTASRHLDPKPCTLTLKCVIKMSCFQLMQECSGSNHYHLKSLPSTESGGKGSLRQSTTPSILGYPTLLWLFPGGGQGSLGQREKKSKWMHWRTSLVAMGIFIVSEVRRDVGSLWKESKCDQQHKAAILKLNRTELN